jgi:ubiquinone/menaquinone biosynthesis C-methylase UbiE
LDKNSKTNSELFKSKILGEYYRDTYSHYLFGNGLQAGGIAWFEKILEKYWLKKLVYKTLEIGVGSGEHLEFVTDFPKTEYIGVDISPLQSGKLDERIPSDLLKVVRFVKANAEDLPFQENYFDRVSSTCLFHHLDDPMAAMMEARRVVRVGGEISVVLPTDPGLLNQFVKHIYSYRRMKKLTNIDPSLIYALEHKNHILSLIKLFKEVFKNDKITLRFLPFRINSWNLNLAVSIHIVKS